MSSLHELISTNASNSASTGAVDMPVGTATELAAELLRSRRRLESVTAILGGWIWETDLEHRFTYMSPSVERYSGKQASWHYGKTRQDLGNVSFRTIDGNSWVEQLEKRAIFGPIDFIRYQAGKTLIMRTIGHPQFDTLGNFTGYCGIAFELQDEVEPKFDERRGSERRRVVRAAEIIVDGEAGAISCVMIDISKTGARLRTPDGVSVPDRFRLSVEAMGIAASCEVRWRRANEIGVQFES
jgi:two-component system cell cycle response regulator